MVQTPHHVKVKVVLRYLQMKEKKSECQTTAVSSSKEKLGNLTWRLMKKQTDSAVLSYSPDTLTGT